MVSEDRSQTLLLRLFHVRHNAGNSQSASQVFNTDISVQGLSPAGEAGRALAGRDAEHVKAFTETTLWRTFFPQDNLPSHVQSRDITAGKPRELLRGAEYI